MVETVLYARVGGPPSWWREADVFYNGVRDFESEWIEIDVQSGWGKRVKKDENGEAVIEHDEIVHETVYGDFIVNRRER